jgi:hypothetical protein
MINSIKGEKKRKSCSNQSRFQSPAFTRCILVGPDDEQRPGWEMWVGETLFGRADSKETLLQYYARLIETMPTGHWRERLWYAHRPRRSKFREKGQEDEAFEPNDPLDRELDLQL